MLRILLELVNAVNLVSQSLQETPVTLLDNLKSKYHKKSVSLKWSKPHYDGGAKITGYIIERRELPDGRWRNATLLMYQKRTLK